ncbi:MAG: exodeoxyribonuclease III [bacterium]|nr:exodeoxyribonuclease III [bacterium]
MKIITWNVNGIRSVYKKGFLNFIAKVKPDILCLQEIKIQPEQLEELTIPKGYHLFFNCAQKPGYSGVAVLTKEKPKLVEDKTGLVRFDQEGRFLKLTFSKFILINFYFPHGGRQKENLDYKLETYRFFLKYLNKIKNKHLILTGDFNIAHQEIDLARPKQNQNNIMFTSEERKQIDKLVGLGFVDAFRVFHKDGGHYTWWPYFALARQRNIGWRIDYCFISKPLLPRLKKTFILPEILGSDHCSAGIELNL